MAKVRLAARLFLLLGIASIITRASPVSSAPDEIEWSRVNIPTEGVPGGWVLARNSDIKHLTITADGTLYAFTFPSGLTIVW